MGKSAFFGRLCIALCLLATVDILPAQTRKATAASYIELGDKFARQGDFDRAIGAYNIAIQSHPTSLGLVPALVTSNRLPAS